MLGHVQTATRNAKSLRNVVLGGGPGTQCLLHADISDLMVHSIPTLYSFEFSLIVAVWPMFI